jgi:hypothetical protein
MSIYSIIKNKLFRELCRIVGQPLGCQMDGDD